MNLMITPNNIYFIMLLSLSFLSFGFFEHSARKFETESVPQASEFTSGAMISDF